MISIFLLSRVNGNLQDTAKKSVRATSGKSSKSMTTTAATRRTRLLKKSVDKSNDCFNNDAYLYKDDPEKTCKWIQKVEKRRTRLCQNLDVHTECPKSCGVCCEDDFNYEFTIREGNEAQKDCSWLAKQDEAQRNFYCGDNGDENYSKWQNGYMIRDACRSTCGICLTLIELPNTNTTNPTEGEGSNNTGSTNKDAISSFPSSAPTINAIIMDIVGSNELETSDGVRSDYKLWLGVSLLTAVYMVL